MDRFINLVFFVVFSMLFVACGAMAVYAYNFHILASVPFAALCLVLIVPIIFSVQDFKRNV